MSRNIIIIPNRGTTIGGSEPYISFSGLSAGTINLAVEDDGSLVFDGDNGGLFSITDNKDGLLHSVNDISGLPILQVWDDNLVIAGKFNDFGLAVNTNQVFIGGITSTTTNAETVLYVSGGTQFDGVPIFKEYTVATAPTGTTYQGGIIMVTDEVSGYTAAFSDGTNWRRMSDRAIIS